MPTTKSCLKNCSACTSGLCPSSVRPGCSRPSYSRSVSFTAKDADEIHTADDWDRSPVDITPKLSYDDILELKEMQVAAARACARAHAARGTTSRYLANVPLTLLPLLPEAPATAVPASPAFPRSMSPSPPASPLLAPIPSSVGLTLSKACLCKVFSADTGTSAPGLYGHMQSCKLHSGMGTSTSPKPGSPSLNGRHANPTNMNLLQMPSPPDTPPRPFITSVPAPPLSRRTRNFMFLPLLDTPTLTPSATPSTSNLSSPDLSPCASSAAFSSPVAFSKPSGAYADYDVRGGFPGVGGSATLGLERKLGFAGLDSSASPPESDSEPDSDVKDEDADWPNDWPGTRRHVLHRVVHHRRHRSSGSGSDCQAKSSSSPWKVPSPMPALPPSPPAETASLSPAAPSPTSPGASRKSPPSLRASSKPTTRAAAPASPSSPSSPASREPPDKDRDPREKMRAGARKMFSLVALA